MRCLSGLLPGCFVAPRSQIAADMLPRRVSHPGKIPRIHSHRIYETTSGAFEGRQRRWRLLLKHRLEIFAIHHGDEIQADLLRANRFARTGHGAVPESFRIQ